MTFSSGIAIFIYIGLSDSFVLHPPSRVDDDDDDSSTEDDVQPVTSPRAHHPNPRGYNAACNVTLCEAGSSALTGSCCGHHATLLEPWIWILGLVAAVALYAVIAYCYVWRRNRSNQGHQQSQLRAILFGGTTFTDPSGYNINPYTPPPEYTGVITSNDLPVGEEPPPTYEEAMCMTPDNQGGRTSTEQNTRRMRVEYGPGRIRVEESSRNMTLEHSAERMLLEDIDKRLITEDTDIRMPLEDISKGMPEENHAAGVPERYDDVGRQCPSSVESPLRHIYDNI